MDSCSKNGGLKSFHPLTKPMNYGTICEREVESMSKEIVYQNKDILFKILGQTFKEKRLATYGLVQSKK